MQNVQIATATDIDEQSNEPDSLFGICQSIGEDFGFDPFFLRVALLGALFFSPLGVIAAYVALGVTVGLSRLLFPQAKAELVASATVAPEAVGHSSATAALLDQEPELIAA
jgi:phage shock protein PspC (stress-responsive transcriptional regulator)